MTLVITKEQDKAIQKAMQGLTEDRFLLNFVEWKLYNGNHNLSESLRTLAYEDMKSIVKTKDYTTVMTESDLKEYWSQEIRNFRDTNRQTIYNNLVKFANDFKIELNI